MNIPVNDDSNLPKIVQSKKTGLIYAVYGAYKDADGNISSYQCKRSGFGGVSFIFDASPEEVIIL